LLGTFDLEMSWRPIYRLLYNKLNWAMILADKNRVHLSIVDETLASEYSNKSPTNNVKIFGAKNHSQTFNFNSTLVGNNKFEYHVS